MKDLKVGDRVRAYSFTSGRRIGIVSELDCFSGVKVSFETDESEWFHIKQLRRLKKKVNGPMCDPSKPFECIQCKVRIGDGTCDNCTSFAAALKKEFSNTDRITSPMEAKKERKVKFEAWLVRFSQTDRWAVEYIKQPSPDKGFNTSIRVPQFDIYEDE